MSGQWRQLLLGDVVNLKRGYDLPKRLRQPGHAPIVSSSGVSGTHDEAKVKGPGVVTGRYGTLGEVYYVETDYWPLNTTLYVQDFKGNHRRFISYFLQTLGFASQNAAGAVPGVNRNHLHKLEVRIPSVLTQRKIASILSAYDDLIENNTRRIAILEEMAQAIYREWFVNFRFPGHENVKLVDSPLGQIPEGWEATTWGKLATLEYGKGLRGYKEAEGPVPVYGTNGPIGFHDVALCDRAGIIIGRKGAYRGVEYSDVPFWVIDTAFYLNPTCERVDIIWAYYKLLQLDINKMDSGSAIPSTSRDAFYAVEVVLPPDEVTIAFRNVVNDVKTNCRVLERKNTNLRTTRDLVLHKLISGQLDVEDLDLDVGQPLEELEEAIA